MTKPLGKNVLAKRVDTFASQREIPSDRARRWVSFMAICGALDRARADGILPPFVIKGGVAIELRLQKRARASMDIDITIEAPRENIVDLFDRALNGGFDLFTLRRRRDPVSAKTAERFQIAVQFSGRDWGTIPVDLTVAPKDIEIEFVAAIDLDGLGIRGPAFVPCLSIREQMAQKIHALTEHREDYENRRYRDLIDIYLLEPFLQEDYEGLVKACEQVFKDRALHAWPPLVFIPMLWHEPLHELASQLDLMISVEELESNLKRIIARCLIASQL